MVHYGSQFQWIQSITAEKMGDRSEEQLAVMCPLPEKREP